MDEQLVLLSEDDLAFSIDEAAARLAGHRVTLPRWAVADLHGRTEGWVARLRLAAVSLQDHAAPTQARLDADATELIADYFRAEVLAGDRGESALRRGGGGDCRRQPPPRLPLIEDRTRVGL